MRTERARWPPYAPFCSDGIGLSVLPGALRLLGLAPVGCRRLTRSRANVTAWRIILDASCVVSAPLPVLSGPPLARGHRSEGGGRSSATPKGHRRPSAVSWPRALSMEAYLELPTRGPGRSDSQERNIPTGVGCAGGKTSASSPYRDRCAFAPDFAHFGDPHHGRLASHLHPGGQRAQFGSVTRLLVAHVRHPGNRLGARRSVGIDGGRRVPDPRMESRTADRQSTTHFGRHPNRRDRRLG